MYLSMVCGMLVCVSLSINVCMFTVSNANAIVRWNGLVETCCDSVVDIVDVFGFEPVLCCDVWYVLCYVWKNHLIKCFCNSR